ncbi:MAG: O-antigen ligase family protein [Phycisphaerales bacterium JB059]
MDKIEVYLEIVPLPVLIGVVFLSGLVLVAIPGRLRLGFGLILMPVWLTLGRLPDLGPVQALSKTTGFALFAFVAFAAAVDPHPKRRLPPILWLYPVITFATPLWAVASEEKALTFILNLQWFMLCLAGVLVARTTATREGLRRVFKCLTIGTAIALLVLFAAIVKSPGSIFRAGLGRFEPWGALSVHVGPVFIFGVPLLTYYGMRGAPVVFRPFALACAGMGALMALLTASRSAVFPLAFLMAVLGWAFRKSPITMVAGAVAIIAALYIGSGLVSEANLNRLNSLQTGRYEIWSEYVGAIASSPILGRLTAEPAPLPGDTHAHNAYIEVLYQFGFVVGIPLFTLAAWSLISAFRVYLRRQSLGLEQTEATLLCAMMPAIYLHGMATLAIYYPTYSWAFIQVFVASTFISLASSMHQPFLEDAEGPWEDDWEDGDAAPSADEYAEDGYADDPDDTWDDGHEDDHEYGEHRPA